MRSRLLGRGAAVELTLGPLDRTALAAVAERAAGRPLPPRTLDAIARSSAGNPFFAEELAASIDASGEVTVSARLREVVGQRLEQLERFGEALLTALAVIDDGFTEDGADRARRQRLRRGGAHRGPGSRRARARAGSLPGFPARVGARAGCRRRGLSGAHALRRTTLTLRRSWPRRARRRSGSPITSSARAVPRRQCRSSPRPPRRRWTWAPTATVRRGPSWRSSTRPIRSVRACSRFALSCSTAPVSPTRSRPLRRPSRSRRRRSCPLCACSTLARAWPRATWRVPGQRSASSRLSGPRTWVDSIFVRGMVAWHAGDWEGARRVAAEAEYRPGRSGRRRVPERHARPRRRRLGTAVAPPAHAGLGLTGACRTRVRRAICA